MIFFFFSLAGSLVGGISASHFFNLSFNIPLSVNNPIAGMLSFWPFIVVLVLLLMAILWYQTIKNIRRNKTQSASRRRNPGQSIVFLGFVTVFVIVLIAAPYYFDNMSSKNDSVILEENRVELLLQVEGMDCTGCEGLINRKVAELEGIESVAASHTLHQVAVVYDKSKVSLEMIAQTIEKSGYTVILQ